MCSSRSRGAGLGRAPPPALHTGGSRRTDGRRRGASQPRLARGGRRGRAFCREHAAELGHPGRAWSAPTCARCAQGLAHLARRRRTRARYAFLERAAAELGADAIAIGHTLDDQAETFLLQLIRGAGPRGLSGIGPNVGRVCRPLLDIRRAEIREWLAARGDSLP